MNVSHSVGKWYDLNKRDLPWREQKNPYNIWISEVILQQTRMNQGLSYYFKFKKRFPTVFDLAEAPIEDVLNVWQGLGYYSRARNMHKTARIIADSYHGEFPSDIHLLKKLPGIGDYSAAAIASLAFDVPAAAIDGNVYRLLARYYGISSSIDTASGKKEFLRAASEILDTENPGRFNQSMIELGALICLPKNPECKECPLNNSCYALKNSEISVLPRKKNKSKQIHRYFYYIVVFQNDCLYLKQRMEKDIWAFLYDFPLIETTKETNINKLISKPEWKILFHKNKVSIANISSEYKHVLSHQIIHAWFIDVHVDAIFSSDAFFSVGFNEIENYPVPRLIEKFLNSKIREKQ